MSRRPSPILKAFFTNTSEYPISKSIFSPSASIKKESPGSPKKYLSIIVLLSASTLSFILHLPLFIIYCQYILFYHYSELFKNRPTKKAVAFAIRSIILYHHFVT